MGTVERKVRKRGRASERREDPSGNRRPNGRGAFRPRAISLVLAGLVLIVLWPVCLGGFLDWDDPENLVNNPDMNPPGLSNVARYWDPSRPYMDLYIPVTYTTWALVGTAAWSQEGRGHLDPRLFHVANLLLHAAASLVVFALLRALLRARRREGGGSLAARDDTKRTGRMGEAAPHDLTAAVGAAVFALHPLQVEAVAWISGLKDLLSGLFALIAIWLYVRWARPSVGSESRGEMRDGRQRLYVLATIAFVLAMLAKPSAVCVPLVVGVVDLALLRRSWAAVARGVAPWVGLAVPVIVIARLAQAGITAFTPPPLWIRPLIALDALAFYLWKLAIPVNLAVDYGRSPHWLMGSQSLWLTWAVPVALVVVLAAWRKSRKWGLGAAAVFAAALVPVLGLATFDFQYYSTVADHYVYVAMLAPALAVAFLLEGMTIAEVGTIAAAVLVPLGLLSHMQTHRWRTSAELFEHTLRVNPSSVGAHVNLGLERWRSGAPREGLEHFQAAVLTRPEDHEANNDLAGCLADDGRFEEAIPYYLAALKSGPRDPIVHYNLGIALSRGGRTEDAIREYGEALRFNPGYAEAHTNLAGLLLRKRDYEGAIDHYRAALRLNPDLAPARNGLAEALAASGGATDPRETPPSPGG